MEALGRSFDISTGQVPVDLAGGAVTGKRVSLKNAGGVAIVLFKEAGTAGEDPTVTLQEHSASTGGTSQDLAVIDHWYEKLEATLDGDETWTKTTQTAAATVTQADWAEAELILVIEVDAAQLSDGFGWVSVNINDQTTAGQFGAVLYLLRDLAVQRAPENLAAPL